MIKILLALSVSAMLFSTGVLAKEAIASHEAHWDYEAHGPAHWDEFSTLCAKGKIQSPINIITKKTQHSENNNSLILSENVTALDTIADNGHSIQVIIDHGGSITANGIEYKLVQFHFHGRSEERINGKQYDLVAHMVHKSAEGNLAVVAILFNKGKKPSPLLQKVLDNVGKVASINPAQLLPKHTNHYFHFKGSLTTPPCSENVQWYVMREVQSATKAQIKAMRAYHNDNYRPVQPLNGRVVESQ